MSDKVVVDVASQFTDINPFAVVNMPLDIQLAFRIKVRQDIDTSAPFQEVRCLTQMPTHPTSVNDLKISLSFSFSFSFFFFFYYSFHPLSSPDCRRCSHSCA